MTKIALIIPRVNTTPLPELGVAYLAGYLRKYNNAEIVILDGNALQDGNQAIIEQIGELKPDVVGISAGYSANHHYYIAFLELLRSSFPKIFIVVGGNHATNYAGAFLGSKLADVVVKGEGEITMSNIVHCLERGTDWHEEMGITFIDQHTESLIQNAPRPYIQNLDSIPFPAFDLMPLAFYDHVEKVVPSMLYRGRVSSWVIQERGCPYSCIFCAASKSLGKKPRYPSTNYILDLIQHQMNTYNVDHIYFWDDVFTFDKQHALDFCRAVKSRGLNFIWGCQTRVDLIDNQLLDEMRQAGCVLIEYGVENIDAQIIRSLRKGINKNQVMQALNATAEAGILMQINLIVGNIEDTEESFRANIEFGNEVLIKYHALPTYWVATPLPGTELYDRAVKLGLTGDFFARNTTPSIEMLENKTPSYLPINMSRDKFNKLLETAWTQDPKAIYDWFGNDKLLLASLKHHSIELDKYLELLFPRGIGNFIESKFFVTGYPEEDIWAKV